MPPGLGKKFSNYTWQDTCNDRRLPFQVGRLWFMGEVPPLQNLIAHLPPLPIPAPWTPIKIHKGVPWPAFHVTFPEFCQPPCLECCPWEPTTLMWKILGSNEKPDHNLLDIIPPLPAWCAYQKNGGAIAAKRRSCTGSVIRSSRNSVGDYSKRGKHREARSVVSCSFNLREILTCIIVSY